MSIKKFIISREDTIYEAFPRLVLTKSGDLICFFTECNVHNDRSFSRVVYTKSSDRGRTWGKKHILSEGTKNENYWYDCVGAACLSDGWVIVIVNRGGSDGRQNVLYFGNSKGDNWEGPVETPIKGIVPDNPCELSSGRWLVAAHGKSPEHGFLEEKLWYTDNQGEDWIGPITVGSQKGLHLCEASIFSLPCGTLAAYMRENSSQGWDGYKSISKDRGETWEGPYRVPLPGCHRPVAGLLQSGKVLIAHRFMQGGKGWLGYWTQNLFAAITDVESVKSTKREEQWSRILPLDFDRSPVSDTGYADWVQFEDGEIYIANYIVDDAPKAHIRGYSLREEDFIL